MQSNWYRLFQHIAEVEDKIRAILEKADRQGLQTDAQSRKLAALEAELAYLESKV